MNDPDDIEEYSSDEPLVLPARLEKKKAYTPWWTRLLAPIQTFVSLLPSHRSTRAGRRAARHFKFAVGAIAFGIIVFGGSFWLIIIGIAILSMAPWLPLPEVRKRAVLNRLKTLRQPRKRSLERPGRVIYDGRRVILDKGGSTVRRVLTDREEHAFRVGTIDGRLYIKLEPPSGKKAECIWIGTDDIDPEALPEKDDLEAFEAGDLDRPCLLSREDWQVLARVLHNLED